MEICVTWVGHKMQWIKNGQPPPPCTLRGNPLAAGPVLYSFFYFFLLAHATCQLLAMLMLKRAINQQDLEIVDLYFSPSLNNFHSLEIVNRVSETQLHVDENSIFYLALKVLIQCFVLGSVLFVCSHVNSGTICWGCVSGGGGELRRQWWEGPVSLWNALVVNPGAGVCGLKSTGGQPGYRGHGRGAETSGSGV